MTTALANATTEAELLALVMDAARLRGWLAYHTHDSRHSAAGFPDVVLVRRERVVFAELKTERGKVGIHQQMWLEALRDAGQAVYLWRPSDGDQILEVLR